MFNRDGNNGGGGYSSSQQNGGYSSSAQDSGYSSPVQNGGYSSSAQPVYPSHHTTVYPAQTSYGFYSSAQTNRRSSNVYIDDNVACCSIL